MSVATNLQHLEGRFFLSQSHIGRSSANSKSVCWDWAVGVVVGFTISDGPNKKKNSSYYWNKSNEEHPTTLSNIVQSSYGDSKKGNNVSEVNDQHQHSHNTNKSIGNQTGDESQYHHSNNGNDKTQVEEPILRSACSTAESNILLET